MCVFLQQYYDTKKSKLHLTLTKDYVKNDIIVPNYCHKCNNNFKYKNES